MSRIKILAGDFLKGVGHYNFGEFSLPTEAHPFIGDHIKTADIELLEIATEETVKKFGGTAGWGLAGAALFGPVGLLAGILSGGNKKQVTFVARFRDGRRLMATTDSKTYAKIMADTF
jgi:hypothetical protein